MINRQFTRVVRLDAEEIRSRRALFELEDDDLARLASLRPLANTWADGIVDAFYGLLLGRPETRKFIADDATARRLKRTQREYFSGLFEGRCDLAFVEDRVRVGAAHQRIGLAPKWYFGAYRRYLDILCSRRLVRRSHK